LRSIAVAFHSRPPSGGPRWPLPSNSGHLADENRSDSAHLPPHRRAPSAGDDGRFPRRRPRGRVRQRLPVPDGDRSIVARLCRRPAPPLRSGQLALYGHARAAPCGVCVRGPGGWSRAPSSSAVPGFAFPRTSTSDQKLECNEPCTKTECKRAPSFLVQVTPSLHHATLSAITRALM
jgi:hypothetical protein